MARDLSSKTNVENTNSEFPYGRIRNDDGTRTHGTPVDEEIYGDMHQFFAKLMDYVHQEDNSFDYNGEPENAYDGFQFFEALARFLAGPKMDMGSYETGYSASVSDPLKARRLGAYRAELSGWIEHSSPTTINALEQVATVPAELIPLNTTMGMAYSEQSDLAVPCQILASTGAVYIRADSVNVDNTLIFLRIEYPLD